MIGVLWGGTVRNAWNRVRPLDPRLSDRDGINRESERADAAGFLLIDRPLARPYPCGAVVEDGAEARSTHATGGDTCTVRGRRLQTQAISSSKRAVTKH